MFNNLIPSKSIYIFNYANTEYCFIVCTEHTVHTNAHPKFTKMFEL